LAPATAPAANGRVWIRKPPQQPIADGARIRAPLQDHT